MSSSLEEGQYKTAAVANSPSRWERWKRMLLDFWKKCSNDWIFNFSGLLAYALLMAIFPLFLVLLAIAGLSLNNLSPDALASLSKSLAATLPGTTGGAIVDAVLANLRRSTGWLFVLGLLLALFTGSRLFITIESALSVVFRLRPRDALHQNIMAFAMVLLFVVLAPILFLASSASDAIAQALFSSNANKALARVLGIFTAFVVAAALFGAIYIVVPNRPVQWKEVWKGTLVGAALLVLYELLFPLYQNNFLKPGNYGSVAGFAIVILVFFYYFAFILLLGAEVNSWAAGQRQTAADLASIIHEVQAHNTTRGAAGPTAGSPTEDMQHHEGAAAMETDKKAIEHERTDHHDDIQPPKYEEAEAPDPGTAGQSDPTKATLPARHVMTQESDIDQ
jgi:membrane protein